MSPFNPLEAVKCTREKELESLCKALYEFDGYSHRHIVITGPKGIGKSTFIKAFIECLPLGLPWARGDANRDTPLLQQWKSGILQWYGPNRRGLLKLFQKVGELTTNSETIDKEFDHIDPSRFLRVIGEHIPVVLIADEVNEKPLLTKINSLTKEFLGLHVFLITATRFSPTGIQYDEMITLRELTHAQLHLTITKVYGTEPVPDFVSWLWNITGGQPAILRKVLTLLEGCADLKTCIQTGAVDEIDLSILFDEAEHKLSAVSERAMVLLKLLSLTNGIGYDILQENFLDTDLESLLTDGLLRREGNRLKIANNILRQAILRKLSLSQRGEFLKVYQEMTNMGKDFDSVKNQLKKQISAPKTSSPPQKILKTLKKSEELVIKADFERAKASLLSVYSNSNVSLPLRQEIALRAAKLLFATGSVRDAEVMLEKAIESGDSAVKWNAIALRICRRGFSGELNDLPHELWNALSTDNSVSKPLLQMYSDLLYYRGYYQQRLALVEKLDFEDETEEALNMMTIAETLIEMGELDGAEHYHQRGWRTISKIPLWKPVGLRIHADICLRKGKLKEALASIQEALNLYKREHAIIGEIKSYAIRGEIRLRLGNSAGFMDIEHALNTAMNKKMGSLIPLVLEHEIRGIALSEFRDDFVFTSAIASYVRSIKKLQAEGRLKWFLEGLDNPNDRAIIKRMANEVEQPEPELKIQVLGPFTVILPTLDIVMNFGSHKAKQVLAVLVASTVTPIDTSAKSLALLIWPDMSPEKQIRNIHWVLNLLRKTLGEDVIIKVGTQYRIDRHKTWIDILEFKRFVDNAKLDEHKGKRLHALFKYIHALSLVKGEPFTDVVFDSIEPVAQYFQRLIVDSYLRVSRYFLALYQPYETIRYASEGMIFDPLSDDLNKVISDAYHFLGEDKKVADVENLYKERWKRILEDPF